MAVGAGSRFPLDPVAGIRLGTACAGIRKPGRRDLVVLELAQGSCVAGRFTRNAFCAAPVTLARQHLAQAPCSVRYFLINTGNANAGTGARGLADARHCCAELARHAGVDAQCVLPFSRRPKNSWKGLVIASRNETGSTGSLTTSRMNKVFTIPISMKAATTR